MKIKNILLTGVAVLALYSCNDYLEVDAPSAYSEEFVFSQKSEIERALNGVYAQALVGDLYGNAYQLTFNYNSDVDIQINSSGSHSHTSYSRYDCDAEGGDILKFWTAAYNLVEYCNKFISSAESSQFCVNTKNDPDWSRDAQVMQWIGEAKCLRAMIYHDLVVMFGDVPFTFTPASKRADYIIPVTDRQVIQDALIADLKAAAPNMSPASSVTVERCSKEFAQAMIARIALTAGGYSLRPDKNDKSSYGTMQPPENPREYYQIVRDYTDSVISSNTHALRAEYQNVFVNECNYQVVNDDDPIFEIPFAKESTGNTGYIQGPTYSSYENKTTGVWGETKGNGRLNAFYRFLFRENDKRREFVNGLWYYTYRIDEANTQVDSIVIRNDYSVHNNKWSKLWTTEGSALGDASTGSTGINFPYMRYADVLLMYAEAANELDGGPTDDKAVECLTKVHARAFTDGDAEFIAQAVGSKEAFQKAVMDERKWEFAGENIRWRDLVRTNTLAEELMYSFLRYHAAGMQGNLDELEGNVMAAINEHDGNTFNYRPLTIYYHKYYASEGTDQQKLIAHRMIKNQLYGYVVNDAYSFDLTYPNQSLPSLRLYNAYKGISQPTTSQIRTFGFAAEGWSNAKFYNWFNDGTAQPNNECKYSFYGFIRSDDNGNIWVIRNGVQEQFNRIPEDLQTLPAVRYILPYPQQVVQRSSGIYKNYYGYDN
ncbi:MAG: RagB/SusD family nutrient uptake outer membrane protein [Prevotella sp.]|nr:RagB/SusD family nutrient uptake outer membrane protein [Prevotella sp.]